MDEQKSLTERFTAQRARLRSVAYRMLGSQSEADDAVQEAWLRLQRSDADQVENLGGWLTTVVTRVCLDLLRARQARPQLPLEAARPEAIASQQPGPDHELLVADSLGPALLVVLDTLAPAERVAFVLHDMFAVSFDEIAAILGRSPVAVRQLASRARRRVQGTGSETDADRSRHREIVDAFLAASRAGDFETLIAVLAPDVVVRADDLAIRTAAANAAAGAPALAPEVRGAPAVATTFQGRARGAQPALIDGQPGAIWAQQGQVRAAFLFTVERTRITAIDVVMDPDTLAGLDLHPLDS